MSKTYFWTFSRIRNLKRILQRILKQTFAKKDLLGVQLTDVELLALPLECCGQAHRLQVVLVGPHEAALHHVGVVDLAHALDADRAPIAD